VTITVAEKGTIGATTNSREERGERTFLQNHGEGDSFLLCHEPRGGDWRGETTIIRMSSREGKEPDFEKERAIQYSADNRREGEGEPRIKWKKGNPPGVTLLRYLARRGKGSLFRTKGEARQVSEKEGFAVPHQILKRGRREGVVLTIQRKGKRLQPNSKEKGNGAPFQMQCKGRRKRPSTR